MPAATYNDVWTSISHGKNTIVIAVNLKDGAIDGRRAIPVEYPGERPLENAAISPAKLASEF